MEWGHGRVVRRLRRILEGSGLSNRLPGEAASRVQSIHARGAASGFPRPQRSTSMTTGAFDAFRFLRSHHGAASPRAHLRLLGAVESPAHLQRVLEGAAANGLTGREMARAIMVRNGITDVAVRAGGRMLSDHYDPRVKKVRLSTSTTTSPRSPRSPSAPTRWATCSSTRAATSRRAAFLARSGGRLRQHARVPLFFIGLIFGTPAG